MKYGRAIVSAFIAGWAGFVLGYDMGISGGTINYLADHFVLNSSMKGFALSVFIVGAVIGSIFTKKLNDDLGRKKSLLIGTFLMIIGTIGVYLLGKEFYIFLIFRAISGAGMGLLFSTEPSYITEISPAKIRGGLGSILQLTTGVGIIIGYWITLIMIKNKPMSLIEDSVWISVYGTEIIVVVTYFIALFFIEKSPIWNLIKQRDTEAKCLIEKLWPDVNADEYIQNHIALNRNADETKNIKNQLKKSGKYKKLIFIAFFVSALTELCGINPIIYYAPIIFEKISTGGEYTIFYQSIINGVFFTIGSLASMFTVDRFGRKKLLFIGTFIMSASLGIIGYYIYHKNYSEVLVYLIYLFIFAYNFSSGPIRFLYIGEITPSNLRAYTLGFAGIVNWVSDFLVSWTLPMMINSVFLNRIFEGASVFFLYSIFGFIFFLLIFMLPETKGKTLPEIMKYWKIDDK